MRNSLKHSQDLATIGMQVSLSFFQIPHNKIFRELNLQEICYFPTREIFILHISQKDQPDSSYWVLHRMGKKMSPSPKWTMSKSQEPVNMSPARHKGLCRCNFQMGPIQSYSFFKRLWSERYKRGT